MSKKNTKSNSLSNKIQNINEEFEKVSDDLDRELSKVEKVADVFNDSLDRIAGSVSEQEVDKLIEEMQSEVNLDKKSAALGKQKDQELEARLKAIRDPRPTEEALKNPAPVPTVEELEARLKAIRDPRPTEEALKNPAPVPTVEELEARLKAIRDPRPTEEALKNPAPVPTVEELEARLKAIRDPRPTEEALKNPAPVPTVEELEARLKKLKDSTPTVEKPKKKVEKLKNNETKKPQSIKPTTKVVDKVAACPKDNKLETNSPATSPEPLVKEPSKSDKSDRDTLQPSMTKSKQTGWFVKIVSAIIDVIVDNIKGLLGNPQIQDSSKQQNQQMTLEKMQADVKKLNEPLVALKKVQALRKQELKTKEIRRNAKRLDRVCKRLDQEKHYLALQQNYQQNH